MMCKTGCGEESGGVELCAPCWRLWEDSSELRRVNRIARDAPRTYYVRGLVALVDFCTRIRAERRVRDEQTNGGRHGDE